MKDVLQIEHGKWTAGICPRLGANVVYLKHDGEDVLIPLESEDQLEINPYLQGAPLLFPANRTRDGKFSWRGKNYQMPINEEKSRSNLHGFLNRCAFTVKGVSENRVRLSYSHKGDENFPFDFRFTVVYALGEKGFGQKYILENTGASDFPFTFSIHTTFVEPEHFTVPIWMHQERDRVNLPTGRWLDLTEEEQKFVTAGISKGNVISGYYKASGPCAKVGDYSYTVSDGFDHWILFNGRGESGLLCVEPQCGAVDGLNMPGMHRVLAPNQKIEFSTNINRK